MIFRFDLMFIYLRGEKVRRRFLGWRVYFCLFFSRWVYFGLFVRIIMIMYYNRS